MKLALVSLVGLSLCALIEAQKGFAVAEAPDDVCWAPGLGRVEVRRAGEAKLSLEIDGPTGATRRELDLATLPEGQRVIEARVSGFMDSGLVLALAIEEGDQRSYRFALTRELAPAVEAETAGSTTAGVTSWWLSQPIFSDPGAPYRIVDVHNPGGDSLEITFRRGFFRLDRSRAAQLDELVFVDTCPSAIMVLQPGRAELLRVAESAR